MDQGDEVLTNIKSQKSLILDLSPSCIEFAPVHHDFFILGTYQLETERDKDKAESSKQTRIGSLMLFETTGQDLQSREIFHTDHAILDLRFAPDDSESFIAATSLGTIDLYSLSFQSQSKISKVRSFRVCEPSTMVLSVAWHPRLGNEAKLAASLSDGQLIVLAFDPCNHTMKSIRAHSLQAWVIAWSVSPHGFDREELYSGGDDSMLCKHQEWLEATDVASHGEEAEQIAQIQSASWVSPYHSSGQQLCKSISSDARTHGAGVTAILPIFISHAGHEVVVTGSYDGCIRVVTLASGSRRAKLLAEAQLGGGVWKLKVLHGIGLHPENAFSMRVLASCMHAGPKILDIRRGNDEFWSIQLLANFTEHESMNYGSDARKCSQSEKQTNVAIVSSSFYDKKLCLWSFDAS